MEIKEIISYYFNGETNIIEVSFRTIDDEEDVLRNDTIDYSIFEEYGFDLVTESFDFFGDDEDDFEGGIFEKETIYIDIPQGIDENEMIILRDRGNVISDQVKGDIKINILIQNNTAFKRSGLDLILDKTITLKEALCGFSFEINYINGKSYTLNNNKGNLIPPGYKKMYPNMGLTRGDHKGSMIIHFNLQFPEKLTDEQIKGIEAIL